MSAISELFDFISENDITELLWLIFLLAISLFIFYCIYTIIAKALLKKAKTKKQRATALMFLKILKYSFALIVFIVTISVYLGSWDQMPIVIGFLTVAMGLALQKPISSILAWIIIATRKPFAIGDRIIVDAIKGDVRDITLTHTYLYEIGGTVDGEERSEREVVIPNSYLFDKDIINYTAKNDYILDEIKTNITYESNLKKAEDIIIKETKKIMASYWDKLPKKYQKEPHIRLRFKQSGIDVTVRFYSIAPRRNEISTNVTRNLFDQIKKSKDVEIAYPHTEVVLRNK